VGALARRGSGLPAALGQSLGLARRRVEAALDELSTVGAIAPSGASQRSIVWLPRPPDEVIESLRRQRSATAARPHDGAAAGSVAAGALLAQPLALGEGLRHLPSRGLARARMADLVAVARHEHLAMNPEPTFDPGSARAAVPMDRMLLDRGVKMRVLGVQRADADPLTPYGWTTGERRPEYRPAGSVPMKLIVVDRKVALFPADPGDLGRGYLEIDQTPVVSALVMLFEQHWRSAEPPPRALADLTLSRREKTLLDLLAAGHTDATAARAMRISPRSVSAAMRALMDRFGVDNRFQLGLALGAARLVHLPSTRIPIRHEEIS
jgi:DNA-binding CsgD family transcriptional regulator